MLERNLYMKYFIGEERKPLKLNHYISEGEEGCVYKSGSEAVKIYWDHWKTSDHAFLSLEDALRMTQLESGHILLPRRIVYDSNDEFCGYSTRYIHGYYEDIVLNRYKEKIVVDHMRLFVLVRKIRKIYADMYHLSRQKVELYDIRYTPNNYIFNGDYWFLDPGCYLFSNKPTDQIIEKNLSELNYFFLCYTLRLYGEKYMEILTSRGLQYTVCDFIEDDGRKFEKTLQFSRRIKKDY